MMERDLLVLSVTETAKRLGISRNLAYALVSSGEIPSVKLGEKRVVVPVDALRVYLREKARGAA